MSTLNVSIVQANLHWHDAERNLAEFGRAIEQTEAATDLFVLPEMFPTGFTMQAEEHAERMNGRSVTWMAETAKARGAAICGSVIIRDSGRYFNRFILMRPDGNFDFYDKRHLFRLAGEHEHYAPGNERATLRFKGWRIRPMICYDLRFPAWSRGQNDYDLLVYVANWPDRRHLAWETLIRARAIENLVYVAAVNRVGVDGNDIRYLGGSAIIDFYGNDLTPVSDAAGTSTATLDLEKLRAFREAFPFHLDADRYSIVDEET